MQYIYNPLSFSKEAFLCFWGIVSLPQALEYIMEVWLTLWSYIGVEIHDMLNKGGTMYTLNWFLIDWDREGEKQVAMGIYLGF